jgi:hypothetical protein
MNQCRFGIIILLVALVLSTGCTQSSPGPASRPDTLMTTAPTAIPATAAETAVTVTSSAPQAIVTVIHYIEPAKAWKDTELHFGFDTPRTWAVTTRQLNLPEGSQGLEYQTDLIAGDVFSIGTYPVSRNQDQAYRNTFRAWIPAPAESTVSYNGITYDRFESAKDGKISVGYVAQKSSANDLGYASVIIFRANASHPFEKDDYDKVAASFRYFTKNQAPAVTGEEIPRVR